MMGRRHASRRDKHSTSNAVGMGYIREHLNATLKERALREGHMLQTLHNVMTCKQINSRVDLWMIERRECLQFKGVAHHP